MQQLSIKAVSALQRTIITATTTTKIDVIIAGSHTITMITIISAALGLESCKCLTRSDTGLGEATEQQLDNMQNQTST